jgi:hypothetical protein
MKATRHSISATIFASSLGHRGAESLKGAGKRTSSQKGRAGRAKSSGRKPSACVLASSTTALRLRPRFPPPILRGRPLVRRGPTGSELQRLHGNGSHTPAAHPNGPTQPQPRFLVNSTPRRTKNPHERHAKRPPHLTTRSNLLALAGRLPAVPGCPAIYDTARESSPRAPTN